MSLPSPPSPALAFRRGFLAGVPFLLVLIPFALLFGISATEAGFNLVEVMGFSILVIAGASQFTAIQMMTENTPTLIVIIAALAVNLRMAMYSIAMAPHLGATSARMRAAIAYFLFDQPYALSFAEYAERPQMTMGERLAYYFGTAFPCASSWWICSYLGATIGGEIPSWIALDFAVPITFLSMIGPMLRTPAQMAAAFVSVAASLIFAFMPYNLGLLVAAVLAMMAGARVELMTEGRK